uniref:Gag-Pol polyprotein n=1 Tax=Tanacetum cinerariifolium TaxID=118510 RepID=A0A699JKV7_TANCI|nr:Gag-Pol polyprotein [Tanacetum cinerariifolium]
MEILPESTSNSSAVGSDDGVTTSFQLSQNSRPPCSIIKDKYMMKAQELDPSKWDQQSSSTEASGSKPRSNTKKDRIPQTSSSNKNKNKVEDHHRIAKSSLNNKNHVIEHVCNANVKYTTLNENSELICVKGNLCIFDANHDVCFLEFVNDVNLRSKSKYAKRNKNKKTWEPTGKVLTDMGYRWKPTRRAFTIDGNTCTLTRITSTKVEPHKETTSKSVTTSNPEIKIYCRKTKVAKSAKQGLVRGLKLKFKKDHLCSACSLGKSKKSSRKPKYDNNNQEKLYLLHMDLCRPMRVDSINGKKYILVIVNDYLIYVG